MTPAEPTGAIYELLAEINRAAAEGGQPADRIRRLAEVFAAPRKAFASRPHAETLVAELEELTDSLRFLVLNVPSTLARNSERIFVAVLSPDIDIPPIPSDFAPSGHDGDIDDVYFFSRDQQRVSHDAHREALAKRWKSEWARYASITYALEAGGIYTWNQYLLHGCRYPRALGLAWGGSSEKTSSRYIKLSASVAGSLGLPSPAASRQSWVDEIVQLPSSPSADQLTDDALLEQWRLMEPYPNVDLGRTVPSAIYHLVRSYGLWGGHGFVSIPILLGTSPDSRATAVLSLCTSANLREQLLLRWHAIANACFASVTAAELLAQQSLDDLRSALDVYGTVAHETNSLIEKHFKNVPSLIATKMADEGARTLVQYAWQTVSETAKVGYFFAKARVSTDSQREHLKARFIGPLRSLHSENRLLQAITEVAARVYKLEAALYGGALIPDLAAIDVNSSDVPKWLESSRFAYCYILCAEPIRNLAQYGDGAEAHWSVRCDADGLRIELVHQVGPGSIDLPRSATFAALDGFLKFYGARSGAWVDWDVKGKSVRWVVTVDGSVLTSAAHKEGS